MDAAQFTQFMKLMQDQLAEQKQQTADLHQELAQTRTDNANQVKALAEAMSPDRTIEHSGVLQPSRYPKLDDFNLVAGDTSAQRTEYFVHWQAWAYRMELEGDYRRALVETKLKRDRVRLHGNDVLQADAIAELDRLQKAYYGVMARKEPPKKHDGTEDAGTIEQRNADRFVFSTISSVVKSTDFQIDLQQLRTPGTINAGCKALAILSKVFDPTDLAAALNAIIVFMNTKQTTEDLDTHIKNWKRNHRALLQMYWIEGTAAPDFKKMCEELCTMLFIKSLNDEAATATLEDIKNKPRDKFTWEDAIIIAKSHKRFQSVLTDADATPSGSNPPISAFVEHAHAARAGGGDLICTNCNGEGHSRRDCDQECTVKIRGRDGRPPRLCRGIRSNHDPECVLSKESRDRRNRRRDQRRTDRAGSRPPGLRAQPTNLPSRALHARSRRSAR